VNAWLLPVQFSYLAARLLIMLFTASLKASMVFLVVFAASRLMRDSSAQLRHLLWLGAIGSYLLILLLSLFASPLPPLLLRGAASPDGSLGSVSEVLLPHGGLAVQVGGGSSTYAEAAAVSPVRVWALAALGLWAAGALVSSLRVLVGHLQLHRMVREGGECFEQRVLDSLSEGARRRVRVLRNAACKVPFAGGVLRPFIMLPDSSRSWPQGRLRAVLLHELRHVERWDFLTQAAARWVCSLFWFVPLTWIAYSFLYSEQEKACDTGVVERGVARGEYAACILAAVHPCPALPLAGLYSPAWRKRILEDRIRNIVEGGRTMKKRWLVFASCAFVACALVVVGGCVRGRRLSNEEAYQRFAGTFVNTTYPGTIKQPQVTVTRPNHVMETWPFPDSEKPERQWEVRVKKTWVDPEGNTYCQFYGSDMGFCGYNLALIRLDKEGKVWEYFASPGKEEETERYPTSIIRGAPEYRIYYRK